MYKIIAVGKNSVQATVSENEEALVFKTIEEAEQYVVTLNTDLLLPTNYKFIIEEL
ncbi:hypothetical protein [Virgibacillus sp. MG-45]|uniref:hypothetical protein n=1 Tax=Virgibacillus sp. MG-45 TaxID=3102791 RepID=UPI002ED9BE76